MSTLDEQAWGALLEKHRLEIEDYSVDFARRLVGSGETLSSVDYVRVYQVTSNGSTNVSTNFWVSSQSVSGTKVQWRMGEASAGTQDAEATYYVMVRAVSSTGRRPLSVHGLRVHELADPNAP